MIVNQHFNLDDINSYAICLKEKYKNSEKILNWLLIHSWFRVTRPSYCRQEQNRKIPQTGGANDLDF